MAKSVIMRWPSEAPTRLSSPVMALPRVVEAADRIEFDASVCVEKVLEHAAPSDGGELHRVANERDPPMLLVGEVCEVAGRDHPCLIDDQGRAGREVEACSRPIGVLVFVEDFVDGVGSHAGLGAEDLGGCCGRCDTKHHTPLLLQLSDGGGQGGGLPGPCRADDHHEVGVTSDSCCSLCLRPRQLHHRT
ncbi:MAG: hypothetical protein ACI8TP_003378 [Acidimicrobiales bacterium]